MRRKPPSKSGNKGGAAKGRAYYTNLCDRLTAQVSALNLSLAREQQLRDAARDAQLLLAEAILNHKVLYQMLGPLQRQWMKQQQQHGVNGTTTASSATLPQHWSTPVQLACQTNPLLRALVMSPPAHICAVAGITREDMRARYTAGVEKLLLLHELLSPRRYPPSLLVTRSQQPVAAAGVMAAASGAYGGSDSSNFSTSNHFIQQQHMAGMMEQQELPQPDIVQASKQLLTRLQEFQSTLAALDLSVGALLLHNAKVLFDSNIVNLETGERAVPPISHFMAAAQRLHLTSAQVKQLQLMLKQYNRLSRQQHEAGRQLLGLSEQSCSVLSATASTAQHSGSQGSGSSSIAAGKVKGQCSGGGRQDSGGNDDGVPPAGHTSHHKAAAAAPRHEAVQLLEEEGDSSALALEKQLQRHLSNRQDMFRLVALWVVCTLTPWQMGEWIVACYPYKVVMLALVEVSAFLTPDDTPQAYINACACEEAAQAAALAEELGYCGADGFMQRRQAALQSQLQWVLQDAPQAQRHAA